jgi:hypothetical protein
MFIAAGHVDAASKERVPQKECLPETDPKSPRKSALGAPSDQIIRTDLDKDGDPDVLEAWLNGKRTRWFDENDNMRDTDALGDRQGDSIQIDRDNDGYYDGPSDINLAYIDDDSNGRPELEVVAMNPTTTQTTIRSSASHYMIFEDVDGDGVFGCLNWQTYEFDCWGVDEKDPNFKPDYNGNSIFLKEHAPAWSLVDPRYNWENPFVFYDWDNDGCTEQAVRYCDTKQQIDDNKTSETFKYDGLVDEVFTSWDLDNDTGHHNELDYDMTIRMSGGEKLNYNGFIQQHPKLKAPDWVLPFMRYSNWRQIDQLIYVPHQAAIDEMFRPKWENCWLTFDEDDDDHRWERCELYYPSRNGKKSDPYVVTKWGDRNSTPGISSHPQADTLGDRGEWDEDFSGKHQMYVGRWDNKIHLYGAEWGAWTVDRGGKYWAGAGPNRGNSIPEKAPEVGEVVQYADRNNNGYIDEITYDYDGDRKIDLTVNLLELGGADADKVELFDPAKEKWQGLSRRYKAMVHQSWQDAVTIYHAAWKRGMTDGEMEDLSVASSVGEKYDKAYWLRETVFRRLYKKLEGKAEAQKELMKAHFLGSADDMARFIENMPD